MVNAAGWHESGHMSQHLVQVSGDPRRPNEVRKHKLPQKPESSADILTILGSLAGVASILLKVRPNVCQTLAHRYTHTMSKSQNYHKEQFKFQNKAAEWVALLCCLATVANMKSGELGGKHILTSAM